MKPKISVYLTHEELAQLKKTARQQRVSLSRYAKDRLVPREAEDHDGGAAIHQWPGQREQLGDVVRKAFAAEAGQLRENLHTVMAMLDQLVLSTLTHLPELPAASEKERIASGVRRHRAWQQQVAEELNKLRAQINDVQQAGNGAPVRAGVEA